MSIKDKFGLKSNLIKTLLIKGLISNGILINSSHNLSYSHEKKDLDYVISVYNDVIQKLKETLESKSSDILFPPIQPIFTPRKIS